jgi:3-oxoacyl-[acyl-carrier protein] reductase
VLLLARDTGAIETLSGQLGHAAAVPCDLTSWESVEQAFACMDQFPAPSVLVNNAAIGGPFHRIDEVDDAEWADIFHTNVRAPFWMCRKYLPAMKQQHFGRVVNISSVLGVVGGTRSSTYIAAKHALVGYTKAVACEWGEFGITANAVCPGYVDTAMHGPSVVTPPLHNIPAGRLGTPEEIAELVAFLCSPQAAYINGAAILADGGLTSGSWTAVS